MIYYNIIPCVCHYFFANFLFFLFTVLQIKKGTASNVVPYKRKWKIDGMSWAPSPTMFTQFWYGFVGGDEFHRGSATTKKSLYYLQRTANK